MMRLWASWVSLDGDVYDDDTQSKVMNEYERRER
jgi:hypothetical protein